MKKALVGTRLLLICNYFPAEPHDLFQENIFEALLCLTVKHSILRADLSLHLIIEGNTAMQNRNGRYFCIFDSQDLKIVIFVQQELFEIT